MKKITFLLAALLVVGNCAYAAEQSESQTSYLSSITEQFKDKNQRARLAKIALYCVAGIGTAYSMCRYTLPNMVNYTYDNHIVDTFFKTSYFRSLVVGLATIAASCIGVHDNVCQDKEQVE